MNEVVITTGVRSAVGKFGKSLIKLSASEMGRQVLEELMSRTTVEKGEVDEVIFGHGYVHGGGLNSARIASQLSGFPTSVPGYVVIKACGSSLKAITNGYLAIACAQEDIVIAGGVESMSQAPYLVRNRWGTKFGNLIMEDSLLTDGLICSLSKEHMGVTAERLAKQYCISREEQDAFAFNSHKKAAQAIQNGKFSDEIIRMEVKSRKGTSYFSIDESVRPDISMDNLEKLPAVFLKDGTVTAGNACPMNDGAAAVMMMSREKAEEKGLKPIVKIKAFASAGVEPNVMGIGPVASTQKALKKAGLFLKDIDLIELNEAFAAQSLAVIKALALNPEIVNVNGGAIALGHPVGATGAKLTITLMNEMIRRRVKYGLVTLCMAGGMGITVIYENMRL